MQTFLGSPAKVLAAGFVLALAALLSWLVLAGADRIGLASFLLRWLHVAAAMIWVGLIWFVNFIQLAAVRDANHVERAALHKLVVPQVARVVRWSSHLTLASGIALLVTSGYLLDRLMFTSTVYIPPLRNWMLWSGTLAGFAMWAIVHARIWPALRVVLEDGPQDARDRARMQVRAYAGLNLMLAVPVTFVMVAAAHLY